MVFADREHVETELIGQRRLLDQIAHPLLRAEARAEVGERRDSEFHAAEHSRIIVGTTIRTLGKRETRRGVIEAGGA